MAVIGEQSSGKSSVLVNIIGDDFLPKGNGTVTRCPLELRLHNSADETYGKFSHSEIIYTDFDQISNEITNRSN